MNISVLGAGSWGATLGQVLTDNGHKVLLWHRDQKFVEKVSQSRNHPLLNNYKLSDRLNITSSLVDIVDHAEIVLNAIPTQSVRQVFTKIKFVNIPIITTSKGIERHTCKRVSEIISECLNIDLSKIVILSGPSHAEEVIRKCPTTVVSACINIELARSIQNLFSNQYFRVYSSDDIVGVEIGAAAKNIIALAAGICIGLNFGDNTIAALISRGLEEITRLGTKLGARRTTFSGLGGVGDLVVTAFSKHSRNREVGERIGKGERLDAILSSMPMVAEGVETTRSIYELKRSYKIEMPICDQIYSVLFEQKSARTAIMDLMERDLIDEHPI